MTLVAQPKCGVLQTCIVEDTREQLGLARYFSSAVTVIHECMPEGDYGTKKPRCVGDDKSLDEWLGVFERKAKDDLVGCLTFDRPRFIAEAERLKKHPFRAVVVEAPLSDFASGNYKSRATPASIVGSIAAIYADFGLPFLFAGSPQGAAFMIEKILRRLHANHVAAMSEVQS